MKRNSKCSGPMRMVLMAFSILVVPILQTASAQTPAEQAAETAPPQLSPLQMLEKAVEADLNTQYQLLGKISPRGVDASVRAEMIQPLVRLLESDSPDIRARCAEVLQLFGSDAVPAIPALMKRIGDRQATASYQPVSASVSKTLAAIGPEHTLKTLVAAIPDCDRATYYGIAGAISEMGERAKSEAAVFIELLKNGPKDRRWATMYVLSKLGDAGRPAIPEYIKHLDDRDFNMQVIACRALAAVGPAAKDAVPKLVELTREPSLLSTRTHAAMCLGAIGPAAEVDLVQIFTEMIEQPNAFSQERGLIALGRLGRYAENTRGFVEELLAKDGFSQKPEAARTLWQITGDNQRTLDVLSSLIDDPTYDHRVYAILKEMGPDAAPLGTMLAEKLKTDDQSERQLLVKIFASMGQAAMEHVEAIRAALDDAAPDTAYLIDRTLKKIEAESP